MWAYESVFYQIYPLGFVGAPFENDGVETHRILKVLDWTDHIKKLGANAIYFSPVFESDTHGYNTRDYRKIDCRLGSNEDFKQVCDKLHSEGIRVVLDGVFNHCGSFNKWLDKERIYEQSEDYEKGAYVSADSPYRSFFRFNNEHEWPYNEFYEGWWGHNTLPKLNYEQSPELKEYILNIGRKWVREPYNVDGWRLDVAAELGHSIGVNHQFWKDFRKSVKKANPEAIILAEHYGDPSSWMRGDQWDTVMNYDAFMEPVSWFLTGMEKHSDDYRQDLLGNADSFVGAMAYHGANMAMPSWLTAMNELSNHDHSRFLTRTNRRVGRTNSLGAEAANHDVKKAVLLEAVVMQMTWPGAPTVYYGDEAGVCGFTDPDNRRTYPWGREDKELIDFHRDVIKMHKSCEVLMSGSYKQLLSEYNLISYARFNRDDAVIVIINNSPEERRTKVPVWEAGLPYNSDVEQIFVTYENGYSTARLGYTLSGGWLDIGLRAKSAVVLKKLNNQI